MFQFEIEVRGLRNSFLYVYGEVLRMNRVLLVRIKDVCKQKIPQINQGQYLLPRLTTQR